MLHNSPDIMAFKPRYSMIRQNIASRPHYRQSTTIMRLAEVATVARTYRSAVYRREVRDAFGMETRASALQRR